ncbi:MAG: ABC transporter transmembrane domain-containing protein, partial [Bacteroidota bacterium]
MLEKEKPSGNIVDLKILKRLVAWVRPYKKQFYVLVFLTIALAIVGPIRPRLIQITIDRDLASGDFDSLTNMVILLIGLLVLGAIIQYLHTYLSGWLGQSIIRDIRVKLFRHLQTLQLKFFDKTPIGRLVTRNISDIETLSEVFTQGIAAMIGDMLQLVAILIFMFTQSWQLALVSLATFPFLLVATYVFKEKIKIAFNEVRTAVSNLNSFVQEHITGMSIVQIFNSEKREYEKFKNINKEHKQANLKSVLYYSIYFPVAEVISATSIGLIVWYGAQGVMRESIAPGMLIEFIMYTQMFFRPIRMIADRFNTLQMGIVSSNRIFDLLDSKEHIVDNGTHAPDNINGNVNIENVWFAYKEEDYVLRNISIDIKEGETIALVGAT